MHADMQSPEEGDRSPETEVISSCKLNLGPLEEQ